MQHVRAFRWRERFGGTSDRFPRVELERRSETGSWLAVIGEDHASVTEHFISEGQWADDLGLSAQLEHPATGCIELVGGELHQAGPCAIMRQSPVAEVGLGSLQRPDQTRISYAELHLERGPFTRGASHL